mgnify:CR=1 FL=1
MAVPLRLTALRVQPDELGARRQAVEAEGGLIEFQRVDQPEVLAGIGSADADLIVAHHDPEQADAEQWLPMRESGTAPPVILLCDEDDGNVVGRLRDLGAFAVVPRGHSTCLIQAVRLAVGSSVRPPNPDLEKIPSGVFAQRRMAGLMRVIGHNLRDVLGGITNAVEVLSFQSSPGSLSQQRTIELLDRQCRRMAGLLDDYSEIARMESGKRTGSREVVELGGVLARAIDRARKECTDREVDFEQVGRTEPLWVEVDPRRLEHLVRHSLHFCRKASPECELIRVDWRCVDDRLELVLELSPEVLEFETPRAGQAIDLDWYLASILADRLGGVLMPGPPLVIELPNLIVEPPEERATIPIDQRSGGWVSGSGRQVVLVDDNVESVQALGILIGRLGWHVRVTPDLSEAMGLIRSFRAEVVLIGLHMPFLDGESLARRIRREVPKASPLLIGLSSSTNPPLADPDGERLFDHILTKPVRLADLAALIGSPERQAASG